jgi:hypothetical protein
MQDIKKQDLPLSIPKETARGKKYQDSPSEGVWP